VESCCSFHPKYINSECLQNFSRKTCKEKTNLEDLRVDARDNIQTALKEVGFVDVDWICVAKDMTIGGLL
jgi:hypothetical protein